LRSVYMRAYTLLVEYEWDPVKAEANLAKHGVDFADAITTLSDPFAATRDDDHPHEIRRLTLGADATGRLLVVCYTRRGSKLRIISARKATRHERQQYEEQL
jgi:uncharacterized DUF497 family protein